MENKPMYSNHISLDLTSVLIGAGLGIVGMLVVATYKQREFDHFVADTRRVAGKGGDMLESVGDGIKGATASIASAARHGINNAEKVSKNAVDSVRSALH